MLHVAELLRAAGWSVADVHLEGRGYDLLARKGREQRSVEVKGVWESASARGVRMTGHELLIARQLGEDYWLYVVDHCSDGIGSLFGVYQDPADRFEELMKDLTTVAVPGSALALAAGERLADMRMIERWFPVRRGQRGIGKRVGQRQEREGAVHMVRGATSGPGEGCGTD